MPTQTWDTPGRYTWVVPADVHEVDLVVSSPPGGFPSAGRLGGAGGGKATGRLAVTPGEILTINVGTRAASSDIPSTASDVRRGEDLDGTNYAARVIVAGAGGGAGAGGLLYQGDPPPSYGGGGGGLQGGDGVDGLNPPNDPNNFSGGGIGGTQTPGRYEGEAGDNLNGAGGAGYEGGGAGTFVDTTAGFGYGAGGGGGSGYIGGVTNGTMQTSTQGAGLVSITYYNPPTNLKPVNEAIVNTDLPILGVTVANVTFAQTVEWQLATNAGFTIELRTLTLDVAAGISGEVTKQIPDISQLFQVNGGSGYWHIRARSLINGIYTAWTPTNQFRVSHPPSTTNHSPSGGVYIPHGATNDFSWGFLDTSPTDVQTAYQITLERNFDGLLIHDTGKVLSSNKNASIAIPVEYKDTELRWNIIVWDSDDVPSEVSSWQIFIPGGNPVVEITYPTQNAVVDTAFPTITWNTTLVAGRTQTRYLVEFIDADDVLIYTSGWISGVGSSYTPNSQELESGNDYQVRVTVEDNTGLQGQDVNDFSALWTSPPTPSSLLINSWTIDTEGYVELTWTNADIHAQHILYRLYRRIVGDLSWTLLYETDIVQANYLYRDYTSRQQTEYQYALVEVINDNGTIVESQKVGINHTVKGIHYWLIDGTNAVRLDHVTADSYTEEYEEELYVILGKGRHADVGEYIGISGSLTATLRDMPSLTAREQKAMMHDMKQARRSVLLRTPFGDLWSVLAGNISFNRMPGVGISDYGDVTIPYSEVDANVGS